MFCHSRRYLTQELRPRIYRTVLLGHMYIRDCNSLFRINGSDTIFVLVVRYTIWHVVGFFMYPLVVLCNPV